MAIERATGDPNGHNDEGDAESDPHVAATRPSGGAGARNRGRGHVVALSEVQMAINRGAPECQVALPAMGYLGKPLRDLGMRGVGSRPGLGPGGEADVLPKRRR